MKFTVIWKPAAETQLATIWLEASDREAISSACQSIEAALGQTPELTGESRPLDCRVAFVAPLVVMFRVSVDDRLVEVASVRHIPLRQT